MRAERTFSDDGQTLDAPVDGSRDATFTVSGEFVGTVSFQTSRDGGKTYGACACLNSAGAIATTATDEGTFIVLAKRPGDLLRASCTAYTSGAPKVVIETL